MLEFYPCIFSRKLPVDTFLSFIPVSMPFFQFRVQVVNVLNPAFCTFSSELMRVMNQITPCAITKPNNRFITIT